MRKLPLTLLLAVPVLTGCDDRTGPQDWDATPIEVLLWSIDRADYIGLPSAYDFVSLERVVVETPGRAGNWDVALTESDAGLEFSPAGAYPDIDSRAGIVVVDDRTFEEVEEAPRGDDAYTMKEPVPLAEGAVFVIRSRQVMGFGNQPCHRYARLHILELDAAEGTVLFEHVRNPNCNDRSLVPPADKD